jgi:hypothetical protein
VLRLENSGTRICDQILGSPSGRVQLADHLEQAIRRIQAEQVEHREADTELEGMENSTA